MRRAIERGFTLVEIMIVVAIIALLAAIAIPNVLRGRTTANETAAIGSLRALISSVEMYRSVNNLYPTPVGSWTTQVFGPVPAFGPPSFNHVMDGTAASVTQGYLYTYDSTTGATYTLVALPQVVGNTGTRSFFANESGIIRHCTGAAGVTVASKTIDTTPNLTCP